MQLSTVLFAFTSLMPMLVTGQTNSNANCPKSWQGACPFGTPRCLGIRQPNQQYFCVVSCPRSSSCPSNCSKAGKGGGWCGADNTGSPMGLCICENGHDTAHFV
ncbi:CAD1 protein [Colletotrichum truncatum]|uniref:CAD1 protein n=1 Tax=Colletotrichum truncatum TaxID=5467 RepID=A0ACC3YRX9_COLTU|nr:CAD1 protein [Colletotrichum truncatum]KAF6796843.1 CAD1 protein [Colletotrichum truncatum]